MTNEFKAFNSDVITVSDRKLRAFTLIELLVTLSVAAILAAMAAPSFSSFIKNNRLTTQINAFSAALNMARSEAVKRSAEVVLCASSDQSSCGTDWSDGWIVFVDTDENESVGSNDTIILVHYDLPVNMTLSRENGSDYKVVYETSGYAPASDEGEFVLCDERGKDYAKGIDLSRNGRVKHMSTANIGQECAA